MNVDDEKLIIEQILAGDAEQFAVLVDEHNAAVYNLLYRMTGSRSDAEDLSQQVFMRAFAALDRFDTRCRFFPWLYTIALNRVRSFLKKRRAAPVAADPPDIQAFDDDPATLYEKQQQYRIVFQMVQQLPVKLREAIVLRFYQDLPYDQIAELLDISISAAKMRVNRGVKTLARQLDRHGPLQTDR